MWSLAACKISRGTRLKIKQPTLTFRVINLKFEHHPQKKAFLAKKYVLCMSLYPPFVSAIPKEKPCLIVRYLIPGMASPKLRSLMSLYSASTNINHQESSIQLTKTGPPQPFVLTILMVDG